MPYKQHPAFEQPDNQNIPIWRYYTSTQLISVFQNRALYFNRADQFSDPFEGVPHRDALIEQYIKSSLSNRVTERHIDEEIAEPVGEYDPLPPKESVFRLINSIRQRSFLNCWHYNDSESITMWNSYVQSGDGVLIKSTYEKLKSGLDIFDDYTFYMGEVGYIPWLEAEADEELSDEEQSNFYSNLMNKQREYESESEFRVVANVDPHELENDETGFFMKSKLNDIIDEVRISPNSPPWCSVDFWENILRKYRIRANVRTSSLNESPSDILDDLDGDEIEDEITRRYQEWEAKQDYLDS